MRSAMRVAGGTVLTPAGPRRADVVCRDGRIIEVAVPGRSSDGPTLDATAAIVAPGLIDLQVNGGFGVDLASNAKGLWELAAALPSTGVTAFLPTLITSPPEVVDDALDVLAAGPPPGWSGATPLGWHLEGPFLSPSYPGVHPTQHLRGPDPNLTERWVRDGGVRMITLAPELPRARDVVRVCRAHGVTVSAGHSAASTAEAHDAFDAGVSAVTHLYNQMPPLHHRAPGLAGAALADARVSLGVIADGHHLDRVMLRLVHAMAASRVVLVTDAVAAMGIGAGRHRLGSIEVTTGVDGPPHEPSGRIAGSTLSLDAAMRIWCETTGAPMSDAVQAASSRPARLIGQPDRGRVSEGAQADLVVLEPDGTVRATVIGGRLAGAAAVG